MLENKSRYVSSIPFRPQGGQYFIFLPKNEGEINDWRADGHRWSNEGSAKLPRRNPIYRKTYFNLVTEDGKTKNFKKEVYQQLGDGLQPTLVHYIGDHTLSIPRAHGNTVSDDRKVFFATKKSTLNNLKETVFVKDPHKLYKEKIAEPSSENIAELPRNLKQLQNLRYKIHNEKRFTRDALYNLHELAYSEDGFVWDIRTYPDLLVVCGDRNIIEELDNLLHIPGNGQILSYDTTFSLGEFYVSPILFRHISFKG